MVQMQSETIGKISLALSKAQGSLEAARKDKNNPFFKSKYADLESVWAVCQKPLSDNELAVTQNPQTYEGELCMMTMISHSSGEWIKGFTPIYVTKKDPQTLGSAITYSRRYGLCGMVGIVQSDDDGEKAMEPIRNEKSGDSFQETEVLTKEEKEALLNSIADLDEPLKAVEFFRNKYNVYDLTTVKRHQYKPMMATIKRRTTESKEALHGSAAMA